LLVPLFVPPLFCFFFFDFLRGVVGGGGGASLHMAFFVTTLQSFHVLRFLFVYSDLTIEEVTS
jgi:hypothetical protein